MAPTENQEALRKRLYQEYGSAQAKPGPFELGPSAPYLRRFVRRHFPASLESEITDLGCGSGELLHVARSLGYVHLAGVDRSPRQVAQAAAASRGIIVEHAEAIAHLRTLPVASRDALVAFDVLEHMKRDEVVELLDEAYRVLRHSGRLVIHSVNAASPFFGRIRYGDATHELAFTSRSLTQLLSLAGFSSVTMFEDDPVIHGFKSAVRAALWRMIRGCFFICVAVETGSMQDGIFSQGIIAVAERR